MRTNEYELVRQVQGRHWWWLGRESIIETVIDKHIDTSTKLDIADVGCGFGANISMLRKYGDVTGLELNEEAVENVRQRWGNSVKTVNWQSPNPLANRFEFMLLADVLEHIPDDQEAVDWMSHHLKAGGYAMITVPAHKFLWTQMDEVLDHHRRYSKRSLLALFDSRFEVVYCSYYNMFLFPVKVCFVMFDRLKRMLQPKAQKRSYNDMPPSFVNSVFKHILMAEASLVRRTIIPFGVGVVCLVRKRPDAEGSVFK